MISGGSGVNGNKVIPHREGLFHDPRSQLIPIALVIFVADFKSPSPGSVETGVKHSSGTRCARHQERDGFKSMLFLVDGRFKKNFRSGKGFGGGHPSGNGKVTPQLLVAFGRRIQKKSGFGLAPIRQAEGFGGESRLGVIQPLNG